jgi:(R,R)-butanediol dehydrogenase / meso-butanediol dehydrogenase / diacetyl reductase
MKAVRFYTKGDVRVEDVQGPAAPSRGQVLIRPLVCGICGTDLHEYAAGPIYTPIKPHVFTGATLPQILGHELSAEVLETGPDVSRVKCGDRVSIQPLVMPLDDYFSRRGLNHLSPRLGCIGLSWRWGGMAEQALVNDYNVYRMPDGVTDVQGAVIEPAAVALNGAERAKVGGGSTVLITGGGPIGALSALACAALGAAKIYVSEPNPNRRRQIEALGVTAGVLDPRTVDVAEFLRGETEEGVGVDSAIECSGTEPGLNTCVAALRNHGALAQIGVHVKKATVDPALWALKDITIEAIFCYHVTVWPRVMTMVQRGLYPIERIVTARIKAEDVVEQGLRPLLDPSCNEMKVLVSIG